MRLPIYIAMLFISSSMLGQTFDTEFEYAHTLDTAITIKNSYPKGGGTYKTAFGETYTFVVFWTCITNKSNTALDLEIAFSSDQFIIPSSPEVNFNLYLPIENMSFENVTLPNYGLDVKSFLDKYINTATQLNIKIKPNQSYLFYTLAISDRGVRGPIRAGFELENNNLIYNINNHSIHAGRIKN